MPSPVAVQQSSSSPAASSLSLLAGGAGVKPPGLAQATPMGVGAGLFMNLLAQNMPTSLAATQGQAVQTPLTTPALQGLSTGKTAFSLEPALLILPEGLTSLTEADLKALLSAQANGETTGLKSDVLASLTTGTPAAQAIANFLAHHGTGTVATTLTPSSAPSVPENALTTSMTGTDNLLLVATNLSPTDMEQLKSLLKMDSQSSEQSLAPTLGNTKTKDGTEASDTLAVALVMFAPPHFQNHLVATDASEISSLPVLTATKENVGMAGKKVESMLSSLIGDEPASDAMVQASSLFTTDKKVSNKKLSPLTLAASSSSFGKAKGFEGSIASLSTGAASTSDAVSALVTGKVDNPSFQITPNHAFPMDMMVSADSSMMTPTGQGSGAGLPSTLTNPVLTHVSAGGAHPASQTVAMVVEKLASQGAGDKDRQTLSIQLDPVDLGRVQIQLSYERGEPMKVKLVAEKQDTLNMLQRDSHALKSTLEQAGIQMDGSSLSFDLASGDQGFNQLLGQFQNNQNHRHTTRFSLDNIAGAFDTSTVDVMESAMDNFPYTNNGSVRYSILA